MSRISKYPLSKLGYDFVKKEDLPSGKDENYLRYQQNQQIFKGERQYRNLTAAEIETLVKNKNRANDWNKILVVDKFDPRLVKGCEFFGLVRIGKLQAFYLEFHNLQRPVGLYDSSICACDLGDNVVIDNVNFISHCIVGNETILVNINEISTTPQAKFGNGILKEGEKEEGRIWLEVRNENGGRKVLPFEGMLSGDAYLWSKYRDDEKLMKTFVQLTEKKFDLRLGQYGVIGHRCVIKNTKTIKDCLIGDNAYIKGANKLKNLTIKSSSAAVSQIGEGCELVNGIIDYGCRIFYGVKAVRFLMDSHSNLKYGARLINSYLGSNATVSCCEVLNSLIFPTHEQHHNNSFLCAALVMGQSNIAAGATIGSNHNSRRADGEVAFGRGFWPGLSVSLKHNSQVATFTLIAKGDYRYEINSPFPFSLISNDQSNNQLKIMPGYWFLYNMYALCRNTWKYRKRDQRDIKTQRIEFEFLAPDSVEEMFLALKEIEWHTGKAVFNQLGKDFYQYTKQDVRKRGRLFLKSRPEEVQKLTVFLDGVENSKRKVELLKPVKAYRVFHKMIFFYALREIVHGFAIGMVRDNKDFEKIITGSKRKSWLNLGGQIVLSSDVRALTTAVKQNKIKSWEEIHQRYRELGEKYDQDKLSHAISCLYDVKGVPLEKREGKSLCHWINEFKEVAEWVLQQVEASRGKDYKNDYRNMLYSNEKEMEKVIGKFSEDEFVCHIRDQTAAYKRAADDVLNKLKYNV